MKFEDYVKLKAANKITLVWINPHASSIAAESTGISVRWAYIDRT